MLRQEGTNTTLTTCTKMTEEEDRRYGVNGNSSSKGTSEDVAEQNTALTGTGGRLKFFKEMYYTTRGCSYSVIEPVIEQGIRVCEPGYPELLQLLHFLLTSKEKNKMSREEKPPTTPVAPHIRALSMYADGKFILELVRGCAREGERAGWVSVPRKTFWPPAAAPATPPTAQPSAALSVSDDNSSVQSSPWQRDHCWKQASPRRNVSKELAMYYCRPSTLHTVLIDTLAKRKRRRPYDATLPDGLLNGGAIKRHLANGVCEKKRNGDVGSPENRDEDVVDGTAPKTKTNSDCGDRWTDCDREKYYHMKLKKPYQYRKLKVYKKTRPALRRKELARTISKLHERLPVLPVPINAKLASCRQEHMIVSPRKRILRELERVTLEDQGGTKRRAKTVPALSTASYPPSPGPSHTGPKPAAETPTRSHNGTTQRKETPVSKNVSSYSIHSLLSMPDESPTRRSPEAKRSPHSHPTPKTESPSSVNSPDLSPSPDGYRYRYSALVGSPGQGPARDSPTPPHDLARYRSPYVSAGSPYARQWGGPAPSAPPAYRGSGELPYVYGYGYVPPHLYRAPAPLWMHYAVPPSPWAPLALPLLTDHIPKDEPTSDLPLNLSKH